MTDRQLSIENATLAFGDVISRLDELTALQNDIAKELTAICDTLERLLDMDLGLSRKSDAESVHDMVATALFHALGNEEYAFQFADSLDSIVEALQCAVALLEVHRNFNRILVVRTARQMRESRPHRSEEVRMPKRPDAFLQDQPNATNPGSSRPGL